MKRMAFLPVQTSYIIGAALVALASLANTGESQRAIPQWSLSAAPLLELGGRGAADRKSVV